MNILLCFAILLVAQGCTNGNDTIRRGALTYNVVDVFGDTPALELARAAAQGNTVEIKRLVASGVNPNTVGKYDITPLWWAAWAENLDGFKALLESGANPNFQRKEGHSLMILITRMGDTRFLKAALEHGGNPNFREFDSGTTPLLETVLFYGDSPQFKLLLQAGANIDTQDSGGWTPMMQAIASRGDYKLVWNLLKRGADYKLKTVNGKTLANVIEIAHINPLSSQSRWREKVIEFLRSKGIDVHKPADE